MSGGQSPNPAQGAASAIWIASYPKSGNTWVQNVVRAAGRAHGFPASDLDVYKMKREHRQPVVVSGVRARLEADKPTVLKTHDNYRPRQVHPELGLALAGFIYVIRNPLDVLLSYINFSRIQYENRKQDSRYQRRLFVELLGMDAPVDFDDWRQTTLNDLPRENLDHALRRFTDSATVIPTLNVAGGSWLKHTSSWVTASRQIPSIVLRYEDLIRDESTFLRLKKLFRFSDEEIMTAAADVRARSRQAESEGTKIFLNKMSSYYYVDYFSRHLIESFVDRFESELATLGYANLPLESSGENTTGSD